MFTKKLLPAFALSLALLILAACHSGEVAPARTTEVTQPSASPVHASGSSVTSRLAEDPQPTTDDEVAASKPLATAN